MSEKLLTIVIPTHNHWEYTKKCIGSILFSKIPFKYEILVVDNASTDSTEEFIIFQQGLGNPITFIKNSYNKDYLLAANQGWKEVKTPYCLHLNNDIVLESNCINRLINAFNTNPKIGIMGGIQYSPNAFLAKTFFHRGKELESYDDLRYLVPMTKEEINSEVVEVETTGFCCAIIKKEVWEKIGYFDEQFAPCMSEQEDYCLRVKEAGFKVGVCVQASYIHYVGVTTQDNRSFYQEILTRNKKLFLDKWGEKLRKNLI